MPIFASSSPILLSTDNQRASAGFLFVVNIVSLWLHDDGRANNATTGSGGIPQGLIVAVEFKRVDATGTGIAVAPPVAGVALTSPAICLVLSREIIMWTAGRVRRGGASMAGGTRGWHIQDKDKDGE